MFMNAKREIAPKHAETTGDDLTDVTRAASSLGCELVEIGAFLSDIDRLCRSQTGALQAMRDGTTHVNEANARMQAAAQALAKRTEEAMTKVSDSTALLARTTRESRAIAEWVRTVNDNSETVEKMLLAVQKANEQIASIAAQVNILAMNAKIEAARAGPAGKGFAIVAEEITELSRKTGTSADDISGTVTDLADWMSTLSQGAQVTARTARGLIDNGSATDAALAEIGAAMAEVQSGSREIESGVSQASTAIGRLAPALADIETSVTTIAGGIEQATGRSERLIDASETIVQRAVGAGGASDDAAMIALVQDRAADIARVFEEAITAGRIGVEDLFDTQYRPITGQAAGPQQLLTRFTHLTDALLPAIQEPVLDCDDRVVFCAAVDRNGYLPTHNRIFSQPPGPDPVWNTAHCRNRRIFDDRVGLKAGKSEAPFLLQIYRRDMGGGVFKMMKDLSAPIRVQGRHWGALRLAYRF